MKIRLTDNQYKKLNEDKEDWSVDITPKIVPSRGDNVKTVEDPEIGGEWAEEELPPQAQKYGISMDDFQGYLDYVGLVPGIGDGIDAANSLIYFSRGKNIDGALSVIGIIPGIGSMIVLPLRKLIKALTTKVGLSAMQKIFKTIASGKGKIASKALIEMAQVYEPVLLKELQKIIGITIKKIDSSLDSLAQEYPPIKSLKDFLESLLVFTATAPITLPLKAGEHTIKSLIQKENIIRKITVTEAQHRKILKETAKHDSLAHKFAQELGSADLEKTMHDLTTLYGYSEEEIINNTVLMNLVKEKMLKEITHNYYISRELKNKYGKYFGAVGMAAAKEILNSNDNLYSKFLQLHAVSESIPYQYTPGGGQEDKDVVKELRDGIIYDTLQYLFENFSVREALKRASLMVDRVSSKYHEIAPYVQDFADQHGITLFNKSRGMTFVKKDGMMRDLVNYLKDVQPKTKAGFLDYINSRGRTSGQYSTFFSAAKNAGLIVPVRTGRQITYQLGPNYEAWENDKLVAF